MSLATLWLLAAAIVFTTFALSLPQHAAARRPHVARSNIHLEGPTRVVLRDLNKRSVSGIVGQPPARIAPPRAAAAGPVPSANVIDNGAGAASAPQAGYGFEGISNSDNMNVADLDLSQPDPQVAVSADHVVEFVNVLGRVFDRGGLTLKTFKVTDFFGVPATHFTFNSRVIYDASTGRWFATTGSYSTDTSGPDDGGMHIAVSNTSDPLGEWSVYHTYFSDMFPDLPTIGLTDDKVTVSSAMYDIQAVVSGGTGTCNSYCGEQTIVFQKSDLLAGVAASDVSSYAFPIRPDRFSVRPAHALTATSDQYAGMISTSDRSYLDVIRITGTPADGNVTEASVTPLLILTQLDPPPSTTAGIGNCYVFGHNLGPPPCIDSGDSRLLETVWRDNTMWLAAAAACRPLHDDATRSCAHLIEVDTSGTPTKTQDIMYGAAGEYYSWPAIRTNSAGDLTVVMSHTGPAIFAEVRLAGRKATDNPNTMEGSTLLRAGEVSVTSGRWGDYFGAAVDPTESNCIWVAGEFAKSTLGRDWSTYIASTGYDAGCLIVPTPTPSPTVTPSSTPAPSGTAAPSVTPTASATPTPMLRFGDVDCTTFVDSLDAALVLQFSGGLITSLACQPSADVNRDGSIDALDAALILQFSAGLISQLA